jgi:hypothetical protein
MVYGSAWKAGEIRRNKELMEEASFPFPFAISA